MLKYAHKNGCSWDKGWDYDALDNINACAAAMEGHLDVLKYARENGCPWGEDTCTYAASGGHLDVLKYLHENGCPWDKKRCLECERQRGESVDTAPEEMSNSVTEFSSYKIAPHIILNA